MSEVTILCLVLFTLVALVTVILVLLRANRQMSERLTALVVAEDFRQFHTLVNGSEKAQPKKDPPPTIVNRLEL